MSNLAYLGCLATGFGVTWLLTKMKFRRDFHGGAATQIVLIYVLFYLILIYLLGLTTGFLGSSYSRTLPMMLQNLAPVAGAVVLTELWRYILVKRFGQHKLALLGIMAFFSALTIITGMRAYNLAVPLQIFEMAGRLCLGGLATNLLLTFLAFKSDFRPTLVYALSLAIYPILAPIVPDLGAFIYSVLAFMLPMVLFMRFNEFFITRRPVASHPKRLKRLLVVVPTVTVLGVIVVLVSGMFRYWALAIGSGSMSPIINVGDVVVVDKKFGDVQDIQRGTVIAFVHNNEIITHRLVDTKRGVSGWQLQTKGDNNRDNDVWVVRADDVVGVVWGKVPLIGLPTVWLNEVF
ncbi:MAG: signal peptidase I [Candidatus Nomurabacteria bacterium]|jgi:signal peptidase|nr:signal peptidase I [Candidatus Nomurabacteria bacterium]